MTGLRQGNAQSTFTPLISRKDAIRNVKKTVLKNKAQVYDTAFTICRQFSYGKDCTCTMQKLYRNFSRKVKILC